MNTLDQHNLLVGKHDEWHKLTKDLPPSVKSVLCIARTSYQQTYRRILDARRKAYLSSFDVAPLASANEIFQVITEFSKFPSQDSEYINGDGI